MSCQFYPLDSTADPKLREQPIEMSFDGPAIHADGLRNICIAAPL
jgi:hypothetical protein